eukprot:1746622-Amphidinium_carterae.1
MSKTVYTNGFFLLFLRKLLNGIGMLNFLLCPVWQVANHFCQLHSHRKNVRGEHVQMCIACIDAQQLHRVLGASVSLVAPRSTGVRLSCRSIIEVRLAVLSWRAKN